MKTLLSCKTMFVVFVFITGIAVFPLGNGAAAPGADAAKKNGAVPLHVTSDTMVAEKNASIIEFSGNVAARRARETIHADSIKIYFSEETEENGNAEADRPQIEKMVASGNVHYTSGKREAFADKAVYTAADKILVLTGDRPKVKTGDSYVTGNKITLYQDSDRVVVEGSGDRKVNALFNPEDKVTEK